MVKVTDIKEKSKRIFFTAITAKVKISRD